MELTSLNNFLKSKFRFIMFNKILDNSLDQKKLSEYNLSSILEKIQGTPVKSKEISIEEEIKFLTKLSLLVQEKNEKYKNMIEEKIKKNTGYQTIDEEFDYENENKKIDKKNNNSNQKKNKKLEKIDIILKNSAYHIYKMQLTQFAESIKRIYKNSKTNDYYISFDNTDEEIPSIILDEKNYQNLISIRDKYSNNDILSGFISKENCVNPSSINITKKNKSLTPIKKNNMPKNRKYFEEIKKEKPKCKDDTYINEKQDNNSQYNEKSKLFYLSSYNICHQCKLQKMDEDLIKCQCVTHIPNSDNTPATNKKHQKKNNQKNKNINLENPINYFFIGQSAIILVNKIYYLRNYDDSVKELVDTYFLNKFKENDKKCEKYYCKNCLRTTYDFDINEIKKKNFKCPSCSNRCNCSRCIRKENLIKQIAYYLNNYGDINKLYDYLVKQNSIFEKLKDNLLLSKFICIDCNAKNPVPIKINYGGKNNNSTNEDEKNDVINFDELLKYKKNLEKTQMEFCDVFDETNLNKQDYECQIMKMKENEEKSSKNEKPEKIEKKEKTEDKKVKTEGKKIKKFLGKKMKRPGKKKK